MQGARRRSMTIDEDANPSIDGSDCDFDASTRGGKIARCCFRVRAFSRRISYLLVLRRRKAHDSDGLTCNAQEARMTRLLIAGALAFAAVGQAFAADLPQPMPPPPPQAPATYVPTVAPVYNWGGIYYGVNGGYGIGSSELSSIPPPAAPHHGNVSTFRLPRRIDARRQFPDRCLRIRHRGRFRRVVD